jgi:hypothetical protein
LIYFARLDNGLIKIGTTERFPARMDEHRPNGPFTILGVHDGGPDVERTIHERFDHLRVEGNGSIRRPEHFRPESDLLDYIAEDCREPDLLDQLDGRLAIAVTLRGSEPWKAWVEGLANHCRLDVAKVIDRALIDYARKEGFNKEAPRR